MKYSNIQNLVRVKKVWHDDRGHAAQQFIYTKIKIFGENSFYKGIFS